MSHVQTRKRDRSNPPKSAAATAASSSQRTEHSDTSQTIYERQEVETRTRRTPTTVNATPESNGTGNGLSAGSPLSRQQEKDELRTLNTRLSLYIDKIRSQEDEIVHLRRKVETINTSESNEAKKLAETYGHEIENLRRALDEVSKDLAAATAERDELRTDRKDYAQKNGVLENEKKALLKKVKDGESALKDTRAQLSALKDEMKDHDDQINAASAKIRDLQTQVDQLKTELQAETVKRVDAENRLLSAKESLRFEQSLHEEQVTTLRSQRVVEVTEVETRLHDDYQSKISEQLDDLRHDLEMVANDTREELEMNYQRQIEDLKALSDRNASDSRHIQEELRTTQSRLKDIQGKSDRQNNEYRALINRLETDVRAKDEDIQRLQQLLSDRQVELQRTHAELASQMSKYAELYGEKIQLDAELATYHTLLRTEELRLNINSPPFPSTPDGASGSAQRRGTKRRADFFTRSQVRNEATAKGDVHITEVDMDGQFVRLENKSNQDIVVGGWCIDMLSNDGVDNNTHFKIHSHTVLKALATMTIWSANTNVVHDPPKDIVMAGRWLVGDSTSVSLREKEGEEPVARRELVRSADSLDSSFSGAAGAGKRRRGVRGELENGAGDQEKNCIVM